MKQARDAFCSWVRAYTAHRGELKKIFMVKKLHLGHVARSFGLKEQPSLVGRSFQMQAKKKRKREHRKDRTSVKKRQVLSTKPKGWSLFFPRTAMPILINTYRQGKLFFLGFYDKMPVSDLGAAGTMAQSHNTLSFWMQSPRSRRYCRQNFTGQFKVRQGAVVVLNHPMSIN